MGLVDTSNIPSTITTTTTMATTANSMLFSMEPQKPVPAPFLIKTYQLIDEPSTDHIVSWGEDNTTFVVWRPSEFSRDLLSKYFKHNNFSSFVRQLNTYGFRKIVPDRWEFANEFFRKGEKHLLCEIHRRKTSPPSSSSPSFQNPTSCYFSDINYWCNTNSTMNVTNTSASMFLQDNERLRRSNAELVSEITHMNKLYNDIIYFVQNHVTPVAPSGANASLLLGGGGRGRHLDLRHSSFGNDSEELEAKEKKRGFGGTKLFGVILDVEERNCGDLPLCKRGRLDLLL